MENDLLAWFMCLTADNCNKSYLGKVKNEPMLVAGLSFIGVSELPLKCMLHDVGWLQGFGASPLRAWYFACF